MMHFQEVDAGSGAWSVVAATGSGSGRERVKPKGGERGVEDVGRERKFPAANAQ